MMEEDRARRMFKGSVVGSTELAGIAPRLKLMFPFVAPQVPFKDETMARCSHKHLLIYTPAVHADGRPISIKSMRDILGTNPGEREPCFYNQDWYLNEEFAARPLDSKWHILDMDVSIHNRGIDPKDIMRGMRSREAFPYAVTAAFAFMAYHLLTGSQLWRCDYLWCRDKDHNGDQVYVGRYHDPEGFNLPGFNIHRHLALRPMHSTAMEHLA